MLRILFGGAGGHLTSGMVDQSCSERGLRAWRSANALRAIGPFRECCSFFSRLAFLDWALVFFLLFEDFGIFA